VGSRTGFADGRAIAQDDPPPKGILRDYAETILICVIFVVFTRAFIFQQSKIPSGSMEDTLLIGDYIMVNRFVYSPADSAWEKALLPVRDIKRGDVVVFKFPEEPETDYIKRVIGLPGDRVAIDHGRVMVNGKLLQETYVPARFTDDRSQPEMKIPTNEYFVMGDHRSISSDSRDFGPVERGLIYGKAAFVYWPMDQAGVVR